MDAELKLIENFKTLVRRAMIYAERAHNYIFDDDIDPFVATSYLNIAAGKFSAAESLYYSQYECLERSEAEEIFRLFDTFLTEFLNNVRTNHSHQWTDIEFQRLKEAFDYSAFAFENH